MDCQNAGININWDHRPANLINIKYLERYHPYNCNIISGDQTSVPPDDDRESTENCSSYRTEASEVEHQSVTV